MRCSCPATDITAGYSVTPRTLASATRRRVRHFPAPSRWLIAAASGRWRPERSIEASPGTCQTQTHAALLSKCFHRDELIRVQAILKYDWCINIGVMAFSL